MTEEQLNQLRIIEQQISSVTQQRQAYDQQLLEIENALQELEGTQEAYHIVGSIMIKKEAKTIAEELTQKQETFKLRIKTFTTQEESLRKQAQELQEQIMHTLQQQKGE